MHCYLVITSVCIQEAHQGMTRSGIRQLINLRQRKAVFRTSPIKSCEVDIDSPLSSRLLYHVCVEQPARTRSGIHQLINLRKRKAIFRTSLIKACEVDTDSPLSSLLLYHVYVEQPARVKNFYYCTCFLRFFHLFNHSMWWGVDLFPRCLTGRALWRTFNLCLVRKPRYLL